MLLTSRTSRILLLLPLSLATAFAQSTITTVAGSNYTFPVSGIQAGATPLGPTHGVAVDAAGNVFVADYGNAMILRFNGAGIATVIAGNGGNGFSGDGGPAVNASLDPYRVAVDGSGNVFVADRLNSRIRRITPAGTITTVAGNGTAAFSGDGGPATSASLSFPTGVAVAANGTLYIADNGNGRIRRVATDGTISTFAGNGQSGSAGDGGPATAAAFIPDGAAVDGAGNVYIADYSHGQVREVSANGTISTVAITGSSGFSPGGIAVDPAGTLYVTDYNNCLVLKVAGSTTVVAGSGGPGTSGDGGPATSATLRYPDGVAVAAGGIVYIADTSNFRIRRVLANGTISTFAGNGGYRYGGDGGTAAAALMNGPQGVATDKAGNLYIAEVFGQRVRKVTPGGQISTFAGIGTFGFRNDNAQAATAALNSPKGIVCDANGNVYIADGGDNAVRRVLTAGIITRFAGNYTGAFSGDGGQAVSASLRDPLGLALDAAGNLYIADATNNRVRKVATDGTISTIAGNGTAASTGDSGPATGASLNLPVGVAVGPDGSVYVSEFRGHRVRRISTAGIISTAAGTGTGSTTGDGGPATTATINGPEGIIFDAAGNLFIAESIGSRIRKVDSAGNISTVAGNGRNAFSGDGGPAAAASLAFPTYLALDAAGGLYIADGQNNRVRKVSLQAAIQLSPSSLQFSTRSGSAAPAQTIQVTGSAAFTVVPATTSGGSWLQVTPTSGSGSAGIRVTADASLLLPGNYSGTVLVNAPSATPPSASVTVSLRVDSAGPPLFTVSTTQLSYNLPFGQNRSTRTMVISNQGGPAPVWLTASTTSGGDWLNVDPGSGLVGTNGSLTIGVTADAAGLPPSTYSGAIAIFNPLTGDRTNVAITLAVTGGPPAAPLNIGTLAGIDWVFTGGGKSAVQAPLGTVTDVAADANGNVFFADVDNQMVMKIGPSGTLSVVAGSGQAGYGGDNGEATEALLNGPGGIAVDAEGNVFIADAGNHRIRRVSPLGIITTVAGTGICGASDDGTAATQARLCFPEKVVVDGQGVLYIADQGNALVRKVGTDGTVSTVAGNGNFTSSGDGGAARSASLVPGMLALDAAGNLYVSDLAGNTVRKVAAGGISTVAGSGKVGFAGDGGAATAAQFATPWGIAFGPAGDLYIVDQNNNRIRKVAADGTISTIAGTGQLGYDGDSGTATKAQFRYPIGIAVDAAGTIYIADQANFRIRSISGSNIQTIAGNSTYRYIGEGQPAAISYLNLPRAVAFDGGGAMYVADAAANRVERIGADGTLTTFAGIGTYGLIVDSAAAATSSLVNPRGVAVDAKGNVYISHANSHAIRKVDTSGNITKFAGVYGAPGFAGDGGAATAANLSSPQGLAMDGAGNLFIADTGNNRVRRIGVDGTITTVAGNGNAATSGDGGQATGAALNAPIAVAVDAAGNLYIAEFGGNSVRIVNPAGVIQTYAGTGQFGFAGDGGAAAGARLASPSGLVLDATGVLYIADASNNRIRAVTPAGTISTVAGNGIGTFSGDGGPARAASLWFPTGLAIDTAGNLYVADTLNDRIRVVTPGPTGTISTSAVPQTVGPLTFTTPKALDGDHPEAVPEQHHNFPAGTLENMLLPDPHRGITGSTHKPGPR